MGKCASDCEVEEPAAEEPAAEEAAAEEAAAEEPAAEEIAAEEEEEEEEEEEKEEEEEEEEDEEEENGNCFLGSNSPLNGLSPGGSRNTPICSIPSTASLPVAPPPKADLCF